MAQRGTSFPVIDYHPRNGQNGPPPAYKSGTSESDTWSEFSGSSGMGKRRPSWTNLVESDENLNKYKVNMYPKVSKPFKNQALSSMTPVSTSSGGSGQVTDVYVYHMEKAPIQYVTADPNAFPAGSIPSLSRPPSVTQAASVTLSPAGRPPAQPQKPQLKRNRLQEMKHWCCRPLILWICIILTTLIAIAIIIAVVVTQTTKIPKEVDMTWLPPEKLRNGQAQPSKVKLTTTGEQVKLQLTGAYPFKGNYVNYYDFKTNRVIVIDDTLKNNGKNLACFVLPLNRSNLRDDKEMRKAANKAKNIQNQQNGWEASWNYMPSPMSQPPQFNPPIKECEGARWVQLDYTATNQENRKCSECHDFCLPDYGIEHNSTSKENYLNIIRRDCFYLFVPEWRSYAQANNIEQNQRDFEQYYRNRNHLQPTYSTPNVNSSESKWIPLAVNRVIPNITGQAVNAVGNMGNTVVDAARGMFGFNGQQMGQQQQQHQGQMMQGVSGYQPTQNGQQTFRPDGVYNLQGLNGQTGNNAYQTQNPGTYNTNTQYGNSQQMQGQNGQSPYAFNGVNGNTQQQVPQQSPYGMTQHQSQNQQPYANTNNQMNQMNSVAQSSPYQSNPNQSPPAYRPSEQQASRPGDNTQSAGVGYVPDVAARPPPSPHLPSTILAASQYGNQGNVNPMPTYGGAMTNPQYAVNSGSTMNMQPAQGQVQGVVGMPQQGSSSGYNVNVQQQSSQQQPQWHQF